MSSSVAASSSTSARSGARTIATGSAGRTSALTSSATLPPVSASRKRSKVTPSVGGCSVATSAAETAAWEASICPLPRKIASAVASITTSESCAAPTPMPSTSRSPTAIPSATPSAISTARRPRSEIVSPSVMIADTGAKNGCSCPNTSVAITHATPAATPAWSTERQATRSRSKRVCIETRERSAASSISGAARSLRGGPSVSRRRGIGASDAGTRETRAQTGRV